MILTEQQAMIRDMARQFAQERLAPNAARWDAAAEFPKEAVDAMGELGLMGMLVPEEWGGAGVDLVAYALAVEEIAAGDGSCSTIMTVHNSVGCLPILKFGSPEQKERFLRPMAEGRMLGAFCVTDPARGKKGISAFLVPTDTPGFKVARIEKKLGLNASETAQILLEGCRLPADLMLGEEGQGLTIALANLEGGRIGIGAQAVGMARAAFEAALAYARERRTFGTAIINHQAVAFRLADMATQIEAARGLVLQAAALRQAGQPCLKEAAMAKLFASEMAERVCSDALQIHGGYGYLADFAVERIYRDVRICKIYEGTSDIQRLVISRELVKG
jgi:alkylation response protein AidB-like acyl-CoA dehydrogenase